MSSATELVAETHFARIGPLDLVSGGRLADVVIAYQAHGRLDAAGRNAILLNHGYTSNAHAAGTDPATGTAGWWDRLVGPGRAIDTNRYFVVSSNMLGSCYGSTGPASVDPRTGRAYGPDFPMLSTVDMVHAQQRLLEQLGVRQLTAVMGASYGGILAFQWGVTFPDLVRGLVPVVSAPRTPAPALQQVAETIARFWQDPNWRGGRYAEAGGIADTMRVIWADTLRLYGAEAVLGARFPGPAAREKALRQMAEAGAGFDANSFVTLGLAASHFDVTPSLEKIQAKLLFALSRTDAVFPCSLAPGILRDLVGARVQASYFELDTAFGHLAFREDQEQLDAPVGAFLASLNGR
jgi:homoserine O-acetyltransferase